MTMLALQSACGLLVLTALAWALSENRRAFDWRVVAAGLGLQIAIAALLLQVPVLREGLFALNVVVTALQEATRAGTSFVFGYAGGGAPPFAVENPANTVIIAFQVLPLVLVVSALSAVLWHWRILPLVVRGFAVVLERTMNVGGAAGLGAAANVFVGMVEAPLLIRPYLEKMTRGELFVVLTAGLSTISGTVYVLFAAVLEPSVPGAIGHLLVASIISLPAAVMVAKLMIPDAAATPADAALAVAYENTMDAVARGTEEGLRLVLGIAAMLLVVISLVALANIMLGAAPEMWGAPLTVERIFGWLFAPLVWLIGVPWEEAAQAGALFGTKVILNEFVAYLQLAALPEGALSPRSELIMVYAMCGFANLGSVGIMIAGIGGLVPSRRGEIVNLCLRSIVSGNIATLMTGAVVGLLP